MKNKIINFRVTTVEHERFRALAYAHGLDAAEYFRSKFLTINECAIGTSRESTNDLTVRADAAAKILKLREAESTPSPLLLQRLRHLHMIESHIGKLVAKTVEADSNECRNTQLRILETIEEIQQLIKEVF